jgi:hypothetical protein
VVTDNYLATVLEMKVESARANVLPFLRQLGIIDEEGRTGERAKLWRDDEHYPEVCKAILDEVYPRELLEAVPNPDQDRPRAERWFANQTGSGEAAAARMAVLYSVLVTADPSKAPDERARKTGQEQTGAKKEKKPGSAQAHAAPAPVTAPAAAAEKVTPHQMPPGININLQVHISADSTPDQIDQIFASMAKHIYQRG